MDPLLLLLLGVFCASVVLGIARAERNKPPIPPPLENGHEIVHWEA